MAPLAPPPESATDQVLDFLLRKPKCDILTKVYIYQASHNCVTGVYFLLARPRASLISIDNFCGIWCQRI